MTGCLGQDLEVGDYPGLLGIPGHQRGPCEKEAGCRVAGEGGESEEVQDSDVGSQAGNVVALELGKARRQVLPSLLRKAVLHTSGF